MKLAVSPPNPSSSSASAQPADSEERSQLTEEVAEEEPEEAEDAKELAKAMGIDERNVPAPLKQEVLRNAKDSWSQLFMDHAARFCPGYEDMEVLRTKYNFPSKDIL